MTLYTSDKDLNVDNAAAHDIKAAFIYLVISIFLAFAGAIYEHFSFGVYSYYMIYAFAIPLIMGTLAFSVRYIVRTRQARQETIICDNTSAELMWHAATATLTVGSILTGALAICGRPNSLVIVYPIAAALLIIAAVVRIATDNKRNYC